ncbi:MAG: bifunctional response regulator/alkaline phosphatase family protein [Chitinispirillaceae bacterium]
MSAFRKKVMWVDDEIEMLRSHIMFLETRGYTVVPVFSGEDALDIIRDKPGEFDIVLLDEQMPGKDGLSTLVEIKALRPDLPVVMVTKSEEENLMEIALGKKIDGYLTKPVNPSQILLICKRLLDAKQFIASEVRQQFLRDYSENATALRGRLTTLQWTQLHEKISRWDVDLDKVDDAGLRQTLAGQKSDANAAFSRFIVEHYGYWVKGEREPPLLSVRVLEKFVDPLLRAGEQVYCIIVSGMRLDQYLCIEEIVRKFYRVQRHYYYAILPTDMLFARSALLAGAFPLEIDGLELPSEKEDQAAACRREEQLLRQHLAQATIDLSSRFYHTRMSGTETFPAELEQHSSNQLVVIVADFVNLLTSGSAPSAIVQQIAPSERALRSMTRTWFENSALLRLFKELSQKKCTVVLTSDHGIVYCTRKTEVYGVKQFDYGMRYKFGRDMAADERHAVLLHDPQLFRLPQMKKAPSCIIAKEDYYFSHPESFSDYHPDNRTTFQQGGISMDEMIMPFAVFTPL